MSIDFGLRWRVIDAILIVVLIGGVAEEINDILEINQLCPREFC
jgi:hypothetical protein